MKDGCSEDVELVVRVGLDFVHVHLRNRREAHASPIRQFRSPIRLWPGTCTQVPSTISKLSLLIITMAAKIQAFHVEFLYFICSADTQYIVR